METAIFSRLGDSLIAIVSIWGRLGELVMVFDDPLSLPEEPGLLGEACSSVVAKSRMAVFGFSGDPSGIVGRTGCCERARGFAGVASRAPTTGGLRTEPKAWVDDKMDVLKGETG